MFFAMLGAAITLVIPLIVRYITSTVVEKPLEQATGERIRLGILMIAEPFRSLAVDFIRGF